MSYQYIDSEARGDFDKARSKARFKDILTLITPQENELLSFYDIKSIVKPKSQNYKGMQTVPIDAIVGSEGRYHDFNKAFLPKKEYLRQRWQSIDKAHLSDVILPPITVYQIGEIYFVRDGNHRVSVARAQGGFSIDAEVVILDTEIKITSGMTRDELKREVIEHEREQVFTQSGLAEILPLEELNFTAPGRYEELLMHILGHKYYMNQGLKEKIPFEKAALSWYENLYCPIIDEIRKQGMIHRFRGRTEGDLYMWIIHQWDQLKHKYGQSYSLKDASEEYSATYGRNFLQRTFDSFKRRFQKNQGPD